MDKLNFIVIAQDAPENNEGNLSLINVFNIITTTQLPVVQQKMVVAVNFSVKELHTKYTCSVELRKSGTEKLLSEVIYPEVFSLDEIAKEIQVTSFFSNIQFDETGEYYASVLLAGVEIGRRNFHVAKS